MSGVPSGGYREVYRYCGVEPPGWSRDTGSIPDGGVSADGRSSFQEERTGEWTARSDAGSKEATSMSESESGGEESPDGMEGVFWFLDMKGAYKESEIEILDGNGFLKVRIGKNQMSFWLALSPGEARELAGQLEEAAARTEQ